MQARPLLLGQGPHQGLLGRPRSSALRPAHRRRPWVVAARSSSSSSSNGSGPRMRPLQPGEAASEALRQPQVLKPANPNTVLMVYRGPPGPGASSSLSSGSDNGSGRQSSRPSNSAAAASSGAGGAVVLPLAQRGGQGAAAAARFAEQEATFQRSMMVAGFDEDAAPLPMDYTYTWAQESYSRRQRTADTWRFVLTLRARLFLLDKPWSYPGGMTDEKRAARTRRLAVWVREQILQLGPTFIKLGQLFSTRSDIFPAEFTEELSKLQDRVPAFSAEKARATIERELGAPIEACFARFDDRPIAAASLGQVHRARLHSGEEVVVKVQRPGLKQLFDIDLDNLRRVAESLDRQDEATRDFKGIYQECATILYQEIDYINEGRNADRFRRNFQDQNWVRVPRVYWQLSAPSVLTLEYLPGVKITDVVQLAAAGQDAKAVAQRATESYLIQILKHGFFHADPHPGNIAIGPAGELTFYDFGMMGEIVPATRERLLDLFYGVAKKDTDAVVRCLIALGIIVPTADQVSVKRSIAFFLETINRQAESREAVATIGEDLFAIALDQPFRFPAAFTFVLRAFATLEGIGKALDPNFSFAAVAAPYAQELLDLQDARSQQGFILEQLQQQAAEVGQAAAAMPLRVARIESTLAQLESGDLKLRVRVLEQERTARRAGVMQVATINTICCLGLLNVGTQLALAGQTAAGGGVMAVSAVFAGFVLWGMQRIKRLDNFEKAVKGGPEAMKAMRGKK